MAGVPFCRVSDRLPVIMRGVGEAMSLDEQGRASEAYLKYLSCASYSIQSLTEDATGRHIHDLSHEMSLKFYKLSEQCIDRARDLLNHHRGQGRPSQQDMTPHHRPAPPPPGPFGSQYPFNRQWSGGPPPSYEESQSQRSASDVAGRSQAKLDPGSLASMHPSKSLPGSTSRLHSISPMDLAIRQNQQLIVAYRRRMASTHNKMQQSELTLNFQRRLQENVAIAKRKQQTLLAKIREREKRQQEIVTKNKEDRIALGSTEPEKLIQMTEHFARKEPWIDALLLELKTDPGNLSFIQDFIIKILSSAEHPLAKQLGTFQYNVYQQLLAVSRHASVTFPTVEARPMPLTRPGSRAASPGLSSGVDRLAQLKATLMGSDSTDDDLGGEIDTSNETDDKGIDDDPHLWNETENLVKVIVEDVDDSRATGAAVEKIASRVKEVELNEELSLIFTDIHNYLDELLSGFLACYPILNTAEGKEKCLASIEFRFFPPLWSPLLSVLRHVKYTSEVKMADAMSSKYHALPKHLDVKKELWLMDEDETSLPEDEDSQPYSEPIKQLKSLASKSCPLDKLECVVATVNGILESAEKYWESKGKPCECIGADDLLPVLTYIVVKSRLPQLVSEYAAIEEFVHENYLMGEEGYCLATLNTALAYVESLGKGPVQN
ncbi:VPS9 domain-containing protein 1-like isoform X2 [Oscarella lobularis]|uniref:VPS9 domain-containing protein 1-like isoform X2 n=1 Tax=Oscarella lobularis TaxID=121494 RepID=UPI0033134E2E